MSEHQHVHPFHNGNEMYQISAVSCKLLTVSSNVTSTPEYIRTGILIIGWVTSVSGTAGYTNTEENKLCTYQVPRTWYARIKNNASSTYKRNTYYRKGEMLMFRRHDIYFEVYNTWYSVLHTILADTIQSPSTWNLWRGARLRFFHSVCYYDVPYLVQVYRCCCAWYRTWQVHTRTAAPPKQRTFYEYCCTYSYVKKQNTREAVIFDFRTFHLSAANPLRISTAAMKRVLGGWWPENTSASRQKRTRHFYSQTAVLQQY